jgi:CHAT domain-containing protein
VRRASGPAGLAAQVALEQGLNAVVHRRHEDAIRVFDGAYARAIADGSRPLASLFDALRQDLRAYLVQGALLQGDSAAAFRYADSGTSLSSVQQSLASDAALIRYSRAAEDQLAVFVIRRESATVVIRFVSEDELRADAATMRGADEDGKLLKTGAHLYDHLLVTVREKLDGISTIAVVPAAEFADIPFNALFDVSTGEYLFERFTIVQVPSASAAIELSKRAGSVRDAAVLAIGANEFDHGRYPAADALPAVEGEAFDVAALWRCARVFSGASATPDAVQRELAESAIIHYAGHIVRRGADPRLLLAPSNGRDSLSASEISAFRLQKARVVVLAACGGAAIGEMPSIIPTMAEAFLRAGASSVLATSYGVEDSEAPATMRRLHEHLQRGEDAAEALRNTALEELHKGRGVPLAVRFQAIGGVSSLVR